MGTYVASYVVRRLRGRENRLAEGIVQLHPTHLPECCRTFEASLSA